MPQICLYLQLHQPYRLQSVSVFDLDHQPDYFSDHQDQNRQIFQKVAHKSYLPTLSLLHSLLEREPKFRFALSASGVFLEQAQAYEPRVLELLKALVSTGRVEILSETYHHSLASLYSSSEFVNQVELHAQLVHQLLGVSPCVFRNTELIYSNDIAHLVSELRLDGEPVKGILTEAVDRYLGGRPQTRVYWSWTDHPLPLLLKHYQLSDDVAFRFSNKSWPLYPLTAERYLDWIEVYREEEIINLFMDFETFGEHQWADTGIFEFFDKFVIDFSKKDYNCFKTPSQIFDEAWQVREEVWQDQQIAWSAAFSKPDFNDKSDKLQASQQFDPKRVGRTLDNHDLYDVPWPISWADVDRDLTAWRDNELQFDTLRLIYQLEEPIKASGDQALLDTWRRLQTSDHFYYMCTKWSADGDVHAYFSPYQSPFEAYRHYAITLADLQGRLI